MSEILISFVLAILAVLIFLGAWKSRRRVETQGFNFWITFIPLSAVIMAAVVFVARFAWLRYNNLSDPVVERFAYGSVTLAVLIFLALVAVANRSTAAIHRNKPTAAPPKASTARIFNEPEELPKHPVTDRTP